jgi:FixJ family two-component response regulator
MLKEPLRVSIVDDEPSVRDALARLLKTQSFDARGFGSAADFIDSLEEGLPDCLVVDFHMPGMTGLELQQYLRQAGKVIPTVVITAHDDPKLRQLCKAFGASDFLIKPLSNSVLIGAIRKAIDDGFHFAGALRASD